MLKDIETNDWLTGGDDESTEQLVANIEEAIELNGKRKIENAGINHFEQVHTLECPFLIAHVKLPRVFRRKMRPPPSANGP